MEVFWFLWMILTVGAEALLQDRYSAMQQELVKVCDCELAEGGPYNLNCEKEGYFLVGYTNYTNYQVGLQGVDIPVGPGYCCRGCIPENEEVTGGQVAVSFVWESCQQANAQQCSNSQFITNYHITTQHVLQPHSPAICCSPGLLLQSGDVWEISECNCVRRDDDMCNVNLGEFLVGYEENQDSFPLVCCQMCLGTHVHQPTDCTHHSHCSSHGDCVLGSCVCKEGWSGAKCDYCSDIKPGDGISLSLLPVLIIACVMASICMFTCVKRAVIYSRQLYASRRQTQDQSQMQLQQVPREGSVGSVDTSLDETPSFTLLPFFTALVFNGGIRRQVNGSSSLTQRLLQQQQQCSENEEDDLNQDTESYEGCINYDGEVNCALCFERPVQVALVPCGHSNLCRKCSRKLEHCPFCRSIITRRQRLYFSN